MSTQSIPIQMATNVVAESVPVTSAEKSPQSDHAALVSLLLDVHPDLGRHYSRHELTARLARFVWRLKVSGTLNAQGD